MFRVVLPPIIRIAYNCIYSIWYLSHRYWFGGLGVCVLAMGTKVRGFKRGRSRRIFKAKKSQYLFLRRGNKAVCPMSQICGM